MLRPGPAPDNSVMEPYADLNGRDDLESWSFEHRLESPIPTQVLAGGQLDPSKGVAAWADPDGPEVTPWRGNTPWPGDVSTLTLTDRGRSWKLQTGYVDKVNGAYDQPMTVESIDYIDQITGDIRMAARGVEMPHYQWATGGNSAPVRPGLSAAWLTNYLLRASRFWTTPGLSHGNGLFSAPFVGSVEPAVGWIETGGMDGDAGVYFQKVKTGTRLRAQGSHTSTTRQFTMSCSGSAQFRIEVLGGHSDWWIDKTGSTLAFGRNGYTAVATLTLPSRSEHRIQVRLTRVDASTTKMEVRAAGTSTVATGNIAGRSSQAGIEQVYIPHGATGLGFMHLTSNTWDGLGWQPNATIVADRTYQHTAIPEMWPRKVRDLLEEQAVALCATMFIDHDGHFWWYDRAKFGVGAPEVELTTMDNVVAWPWRLPELTTRSEVEVEYTRASMQGSGATGAMTVFQAPDTTIDPGERAEWWAEPDSDEDWIGVITRTSYEPPRWDSRVIPWAFTKEGDEHRKVPADQMPFSVSAVTPSTIKLSVRNQTQLPVAKLINKGTAYDHVGRAEAEEERDATYQAALREFIQSAPPGSWGPIYPRVNWQDHSSKWSGVITPLVPAWGRIRWYGDSYVATTNAVNSAKYTHEAKWHIQDDKDAKEIGDWLAAQVGTPLATVSGMEIVPDPRLMIGSIVRVTDNTHSHFSMNFVVTGLSLNGEPGSLTMSIDATPVAGSLTARPTWREETAMALSQSYNVRTAQAKAAGQTYEQQTMNPLRG